MIKRCVRAAGSHKLKEHTLYGDFQSQTHIQCYRYVLLVLLIVGYNAMQDKQKSAKVNENAQFYSFWVNADSQ